MLLSALLLVTGIALPASGQILIDDDDYAVAGRSTGSEVSDDDIRALIDDEESTYTVEDLEEEVVYDPFGDLLADTLVQDEDPVRFVPLLPLPNIAFMPVVFDSLTYMDSTQITPPGMYVGDDIEALDWVKSYGNSMRRYRQLKQYYMLHNIPAVRYNIYTMPKPPAKYTVTVDPTESKITIREVTADKSSLSAEAASLDVAPRHWIHDFDFLLQFSQAYISPNWYQGGNNNVNGIGKFRWNVKLNQKFHPNLMFEATTQYSLAMASAPQDTVHSYTISEDRFQFNATGGVRAFQRWFYSMNVMFKTQLLNNYKANTRDLKAAFMSPGEFNLGLGMTYNYANPKNTLKLDASISPISYNLKISTNPGVNEEAFGIKPGRHTVSNVGSNAEVKLTWNIMWNISYNSRLFIFTDYDYLTSDWENTFNFGINRYLSTQLFMHLRYDTSRPSDDGSWHKWQFKEILSFGFRYQFKTV